MLLSPSNSECVRIVSISLLKYFEPAKIEQKCSDARLTALSISIKDKNGILGEELITISEEFQDIDYNNKTATSSERAVYKDVDEVKIKTSILVKMETLKLYQSLKVTSVNLMKAQ